MSVNHYISRPRGFEKSEWSLEHQQHLLENYHLMSNEELAVYYGKTPQSVKTRARRQMLSKKVNNA